MNKLIILLSVLVSFSTSVLSQSTFWVIKGGVGDETDVSLDTLPGGNIAMAYTTKSTASGVADFAFEVWPKGASSPSVEAQIGTSAIELLQNIKQYKGDIYLLGRGLQGSVSSQNRPLMLKIDSTGSVLSSFFSHHASYGGNYGTFYDAVFQEDTVFLGGLARGGNEDLIFARYNLNTSSQISSNNWHIYQTERLRGLLLGNEGRRIFGASYSYSVSRPIRPVFLVIDPVSGTPSHKFQYSLGGSFSQLTMAGNDSIDVLGYSTSGFLARLDTLGNPGRGIRINGSGTSTTTLSRMTRFQQKIYLSGRVNNESLGNGQNDGIVICLDADYQLLWAKVYGGSGDESITDLQVVGNHLYLAGTTNTSGMGGTDVMLIKTDLNGNVAGSSACFSAIDLTGSIGITSFSMTKSVLNSLTIRPSNFAYSYAATDQPATGIFNDACSVLETNYMNLSESLEMEKSILNIFPNPFQNQFQFVVNEPGTLRFELYTLNGIRVRQGEKHLEAGENWTIASEDLSAGNYVMKYSISNAEIIHHGTKRLIKP